MEGHAAHDDAFYVPKELLEEWARRDPLDQYRSRLRQTVGFTEEEDERLHEEVAELLNDAVRRADASPLPDGSTLAEGVYEGD